MDKITINLKDIIVPFETLKGLTFTEVKQTGEEAITFTSTCGKVFTLEHVQSCCEGVYIESVVGDLQDLVGNPILLAEEVNNADDENIDNSESFTWTFYKLATIKGYVDTRWYGSSNGYYSETADLYLSMQATEDEFTSKDSWGVCIKHKTEKFIYPYGYSKNYFPFQPIGTPSVWVHLVDGKVKFSYSSTLD